MQIKLYNTMTRKIEEFKPLVPGQVSFYSCGPTVYWDQHLGNMRTFISNDLIKRMFMANGFKVTHVMNFTDVGHLVGDEDEDGGEGKKDKGTDKMQKAAVRENKSVWDIAKRYINSVVSDMNDLNIIQPTYTPRATDYIAEQIDLIKKLQDLGYAYVIPGKGVYYDTAKFADYGELSGQKTSNQRGGNRISDEGKHNPADFVLWAFLPDNAKNEMIWDSPWGRGFPGWHIECSAMSMKLLGNHFDIHTAAQEHINIHHTNEIAQSEPVTGKPWVNYWVHFGWLMASADAKLSKSAGDALTVPYIKSKGYDPMAFRYMMLLGHYRSPLEFSWDALDAAATSYKNIIKKVAGVITDANEQVSKTNASDVWRDKMLEDVSDNLKTATAIVDFQEMLKDDTLTAGEKMVVIQFADDLLGLQFIDRAKKLLTEEAAPIPAEVQKLADDRIAAKAAKDWVLADKIRAQVEDMGWLIQDSKDGMKIFKK